MCSRSEDGIDKHLVVINVYCPMAVLDDPDSVDRMAYKLKFYDVLQKRAEAIAAAGRLVLNDAYVVHDVLYLLYSFSHVIILGDVNASHRMIDHCDPCDETVLCFYFV
jgi:AP endonuclease-2